MHTGIRANAPNIRVLDSYTFFFSFSFSFSLSFSFSFLFSFSVFAFGFFSFGCLFAMAVSNSDDSFNKGMYIVQRLRLSPASASTHNLMRFAHFCYITLWNGQVFEAILTQFAAQCSHTIDRRALWGSPRMWIVKHWLSDGTKKSRGV